MAYRLRYSRSDPDVLPEEWANDFRIIRSCESDAEKAPEQAAKRAGNARQAGAKQIQAENARLKAEY